MKAPEKERVRAPINKDNELKICGFHAVQATFAARPQDIIRVYVTQELVTKASQILKYCAKHKKAYHIVTGDDLKKVSGSSHHEGICALAKSAPKQSFDAMLSELAGPAGKSANSNKASVLLLISEDVSNPHNVGAMLRVAAHFGVKCVLIPKGTGPALKPSAALLRTAEGGGEVVPMIEGPEIGPMITALKNAGISVVATDGKSDRTIYDKDALPSRVAVILGHERRGVSAAAKKISSYVAAIPGSGAIDSLNVSAASAVICSEYWRRHQTKASKA